MRVQYTKSNVMVVHADNGKMVRIMPGMNEISEENWNAIKNHENVAQKIGGGFLVVVSAGPSKKPADAPVSDETEGQEAPEEGAASTLSDVNAKAAVEIVSQTYDMALLKKWAEEENRASVVKAIEAQIKVIDNPPAGGGKKKDE